MNKRHPNYMARLLLSVAIFFVFFAFGFNYIGANDFAYVLRWWLMLIFLGLAFHPITATLFRHFNDGGWPFAKTLGIAFAGWLMWLMSSVKILKFTRMNCILLTVFVFLLNILFVALRNRGKSISRVLRDCYTPDRICSMMAAETIFFAFFVVWCYIKGFSPDANGTERFMDFGFMITMFKSDYMPPADMWLSGNSINYYYVGQYMATFLTKLAGVPVQQGYNIAMMMLAAMGFALSYSIGNNLMSTFIRDRAKKNRMPKDLEETDRLGCVSEESGKAFFRPTLAGVLSGVAVAMVGTMHYPIYKYIYPKLQQFAGEDQIYSYWFPDATRYIGYMPDVEDKTIHEFPIYSYVIGDLHAHVINTIFVLTVLALLLAWLQNRREELEIVQRFDKAPRMPSIFSEVFHPALVLCAFLIGLFHTTNYWDFPIYFVVSGAIVLFSNLVLYRFKLLRPRALLVTALQAVMFLSVGALVALPFTLTFESISSAIAWCGRDHHTAQYQLMVLWGLPNLCVFSYLGLRIHEHVKTRKASRAEAVTKEYADRINMDEEQVIEDNIRPYSLEDNVFRRTFARVMNASERSKKKKQSAFMRFMNALSIADIFVITIGLCAYGLVLLPEYIYVVDIYGKAYLRSNTMFKLTYQAFIMFGLSMGFIITRFVTMPRNRLMKGIGIVAAILFLSTVGYFNEAISRWFNGYHQGLDATTFIRDDYSATDAELIDYINENFEEQVNVLEMCGLSYTYFNRVSAFTGMPTVLGWQTHEWLWRSSGADKAYPESVKKRHEDVVSLYTSRDVAQLGYLVEKYNLDYIFVGRYECVDGYYEVGLDQIGKGTFTLENTVDLEGGRRWYKIDQNTETWFGLSIADDTRIAREKESGLIDLLAGTDDLTKQDIKDKYTGQASYLFRVDRAKTKALAEQYLAAHPELRPVDSAE